MTRPRRLAFVAVAAVTAWQLLEILDNFGFRGALGVVTIAIVYLIAGILVVEALERWP